MSEKPNFSKGIFHKTNDVKVNTTISNTKIHRIQLSALGESRPGKGDAGSSVRTRAPGAAAAAGGGAGSCGGGPQEVSPGGDRTPERGASFRDGGTENSATGAGERTASWELFSFTRSDLCESDLKIQNILIFSVVVGC